MFVSGRGAKAIFLSNFRKVPIGIQDLYYGWEMAKWNLFSITGILCAKNLAETLSF